MTSKGATIDVGAWLRELRLGQYEAAFRENAVNEKVLPNLTAEDLKDMGIGIVGHRRMLLNRTPAQTPKRRAPVRRGDVLRFGGLYRHCREART